MPAPKVVPVSEDQYAKEKAAVAARCIQAEVIGEQPVRDANTRESVEFGGIVSLDPKTTHIDHLVRSGVVKLVSGVKAEA